jgi:hypothetical protein
MQWLKILDLQNTREGVGMIRHYGTLADPPSAIKRSGCRGARDEG